MSLLSEAAESVLLGESILSVRAGFLWGKVEALDPDDFEMRWMALVPDERDAHEASARSFTADLVRRLGERHAGDARACAALRLWCDRQEDYEAFDSLLCYFEFPGKERVLEAGRRLFPSTLTSHWA